MLSIYSSYLPACPPLDSGSIKWDLGQIVKGAFGKQRLHALYIGFPYSPVYPLQGNQYPTSQKLSFGARSGFKSRSTSLQFCNIVRLNFFICKMSAVQCYHSTSPSWRFFNSIIPMKYQCPRLLQILGLEAIWLTRKGQFGSQTTWICSLD